jgi:hypothetical protein
MNEAIKLAIEKGGYNLLGDSTIGRFTRYCKAEVIQDPLFWQALGKALRWESNYQRKRGGYHFAWLHNAIQYHEMVLTDGDTDTFWKELLK